MIETDRHRAAQAKALALEHYRHAMSILGREDNTEHFIRLISQFHAAMWRWKHIKGNGILTTEKDDMFF